MNTVFHSQCRTEKRDKDSHVPGKFFHPTEAEIQDIIDKYAIDVKQLPKILVQDPAIQLLGAKIGDVIKITRDSPTAGAYVMYRYCIE